MKRVNHSLPVRFGVIVLTVIAIASDEVQGWSTLLDRTAVDPDLFESPFGVPVDYGYNETSASPWKLNSVPGCPKSIDGFPWVHYADPPKCYLAGQRGPCRYGSFLRAQRGSTYGVCSSEEGYFPVSRDDRYKYYVFSNNVEDSRHNTWYSLWQRGPCGPGQWLSVDGRSSSACVPHCSGGFSGPMWYDRYSRGGKCVPSWIGSQGPHGGSSGSYNPYDCPHGGGTRLRYSTVLKKCVPMWPEDYVFVG